MIKADYAAINLAPAREFSRGRETVARASPRELFTAALYRSAEKLHFGRRVLCCRSVRARLRGCYDTDTRSHTHTRRLI